MKLTLESSELKKIARAFSPVIGYSTLSGDALTFEPQAGRFNLSDMGLGITVYRPDIVDMKLDEPTVSFSATKFASVAGVLHGDAEFEFGAGGITLRSGLTRYSLPYSDRASAPVEVDGRESTANFEASALSSVLNQAKTVFIGGVFYTVVKLEATGELLRAVATDGVRLIVAETPARSRPLDILISQRAVDAILNLPGEIISVSCTPTTNLFVSDGVAIVDSKTSAKFPNCSAYVKGVKPTSTYVVEAEKMHDALARLAPMIDEKNATITVVFGSGQCRLSTLANDAEDAVPLISDSTDALDDFLSEPDQQVTLKLKYKYLTSFFKLMKGHVIIGVESPSKPVMFEAGTTKLIMAPVVK